MNRLSVYECMALAGTAGNKKYKKSKTLLRVTILSGEYNSQKASKAVSYRETAQDSLRKDN